MLVATAVDRVFACRWRLVVWVFGCDCKHTRQVPVRTVTHACTHHNMHAQTHTQLHTTICPHRQLY